MPELRFYVKLILNLQRDLLIRDLEYICRVILGRGTK